MIMKKKRVKKKKRISYREIRQNSNLTSSNRNGRSAARDLGFRDLHLGIESQDVTVVSASVAVTERVWGKLYDALVVPYVDFMSRSMIGAP